MILVIIAAFIAGFLAATAVHHLSHKDQIVRIKEDATKALADAHIVSYGMGWQRCYSDEVVAKKRAGNAAHQLMPLH